MLNNDTPGSIILTPYGPGVITHNNKHQHILTCRIWRQPYKSIASESILYWNIAAYYDNDNDKNASIVGLPAVPGMTCMWRKDENVKEKVLVLSYSMRDNSYTVETVLGKRVVN